MEIKIEVNGFIYTADVDKVNADALQDFADHMIAAAKIDADENTSATTEDKVTPARSTLLHDAHKIVMHDRNTAYGNPEDNFANIAAYWNVYLIQRKMYTDITSQDVAMMMILMKTARLGTNPNHRDSLVDVAGYAACAADCQQTE